MVTSVSGLTRSGLADFVVQRLSAYVMVLYTLCLIGFFISNSITYESLHQMFDHPVMRWFTFFALLSMAAHAWIGVWTVGTDYIREPAFGAGATWLRGLYQLACVTLILVYVAFGIQILWGL